MRITFVRHGFTSGNFKKQYIGSTDHPLCEKWVSEYKFTVDSQVKEAFVSGKIRTQQTCDIIYPQAVQIVDSRLDEMDFGDFEGKSYIDLKDSASYTEWVNGGCEAGCPNGESREEFINRVGDCFLDIVTGNTSDHLFFVVHGGTIMGICHRFVLGEKSYFDWQVSCMDKLEFVWNGRQLEEIL